MTQPLGRQRLSQGKRKVGVGSVGGREPQEVTVDRELDQDCKRPNSQFLKTSFCIGAEQVGRVETVSRELRRDSVHTVDPFCPKLSSLQAASNMEQSSLCCTLGLRLSILSRANSGI